MPFMSAPPLPPKSLGVIFNHLMVDSLTCRAFSPSFDFPLRW